MEDATDNVHATAIALGERAVLIRGPSGAGKSDLALRCLALAPSRLITSPAVLVADDRVDIRRQGKKLEVSAPAAIRGRLEVRGIGIIEVPYKLNAELALVVDLVAAAVVARLPEPAEAEILGLRRPLLRLDGLAASAPIKLLLALAASHAGAKPVV